MGSLQQVFIYKPNIEAFQVPDAAHVHHIARVSKWDLSRHLDAPRPNPMEMLDERSKARWLCLPRIARGGAASQVVGDGDEQRAAGPPSSSPSSAHLASAAAQPLPRHAAQLPGTNVDPLGGGAFSESDSGAASAFDLFDGSLRLSGVRSRGVIDAPILHERDSPDNSSGASSVPLGRPAFAASLLHARPGGAAALNAMHADDGADAYESDGADKDEIEFAAGNGGLQPREQLDHAYDNFSSSGVAVGGRATASAAHSQVASFSGHSAPSTAAAVAAASGVQASAFSFASVTAPANPLSFGSEPPGTRRSAASAPATSATSAALRGADAGAAAMPGPHVTGNPLGMGPIIITGASGMRPGDAVKRRLPVDATAASSSLSSSSAAGAGSVLAHSAAPGAAKRQRTEGLSGSEALSSDRSTAHAGGAASLAGPRISIGAASAASMLSTGSASAGGSAAAASTGASSAAGVRRLSSGGAKARAATGAAAAAGGAGKRSSAGSAPGGSLSGGSGSGSVPDWLFMDAEPCISPPLDSAPTSFDGTLWVRQLAVSPSFLLTPQHGTDGASGGRGSGGASGASGPLMTMFRASAASASGLTPSSSTESSPPAARQRYSAVTQSAIETLRRLLGTTFNMADRRVFQALQDELQAAQDAADGHAAASAGGGAAYSSESGSIEGLCWTFVGPRGHPASTLAAVFLIRRIVGTTSASSFYCLPLCSHKLLSEAMRPAATGMGSPVAIAAEDLLSREDRWLGLGNLLCSAPAVPKATYDAKSLLYALLRCPLTARMPFHKAHIWDTMVAAWMLCPDAATGTKRVFTSEHLLPRSHGTAGSSSSSSAGGGLPRGAVTADDASREARLRSLGLGSGIELSASAEAFAFDNIVTVFRGGAGAGAAGSVGGAGAGAGSLSVLSHLRQIADVADALSVCLDAHGLLAPFLMQESRMLPALAACEIAGIGFEASPLEGVARQVQSRLAALEAEAHALAGRPFSLTSAPQVADMLYEELRLPRPVKQGGDTGSALHNKNGRKGEARHDTANEAQLLHLSSLHPLPGVILQHRKLSKLESTFMTPLSSAAAPARLGEAGADAASHGDDVGGRLRLGLPSHRIHTQLQQTRTGTGRLSSANPNLQNLPRAEGGAAGSAPAAMTGHGPGASVAGAGSSSSAWTGGASAVSAEPGPGATIEAQEARYACLVRACFIANASLSSGGQAFAGAGALGPGAGQHIGGIGTFFSAEAAGASALRSSGPVAGSGRVLLSLDYSQIEVRVMAHLARDEGLMRVFAAPPASLFSGSGAGAGAGTGVGSGMEGSSASSMSSSSSPSGPFPPSSAASAQAGDVYCRMASAVFRTPLASVTPVMRSRAKTVVLGLMYGLGQAETARKLGVSEAQAREARDAFLRAYPGVKRFMDAAKGFAARHGYVVTMTGRKRWLRGINASDAGANAYAARQAVNTVVQGSAADIVKAAVFATDAWLRCGIDAAADLGSAGAAAASSASGRTAASEGMAAPSIGGARLLLQIHDELLFEVPDDRDVIAAFVRTATRHLTVTAPLLVAATARATGGIEHRARTGDPTALEALNSLLGGTCLLRVPLPVNAEMGHNWGAMHEYR